MRLYFHNMTLYTGERALPDACVITEDARIAYAGPLTGAPAMPGAQTYDLGGGVMMPGLVNAHTHLAMTLLRGVASDRTLQDWLSVLWPMEDRLNARRVRAGSVLGIMEMLRCGVTCFADMYFFMDEVARVVDETGMRAYLCRGMVGDGADGVRLPEGEALCREWNGAADGRIRACLGPHAEYTTTPAFLKKVKDSAEKLGVGLHIHVSETRTEVAGCRERHGVSPVQYLDGLGMFELPTLAAHCVAVDAGDIEILARNGVYVAHNPVSNLKLASGIAPVSDMARAGVRLCLGTDGASSNNNLDMFEETKIAAILAKGATLDPRQMPAAQALAMATRAGARALGFEDVGLIAPGMRADLVALDAASPAMCPMPDVEAALVYAARGSDVRMTVVDGRVLYRDGAYTTIDAERALHEAREAALALTHD